MKVIFLDVDGVLNRDDSQQELDFECVDHLKAIIDATNSQIVVSSSWRTDPRALNYLAKFLADKGVIDSEEGFLGITPIHDDLDSYHEHGGGYTRAHVIANWLKDWVVENGVTSSSFSSSFLSASSSSKSVRGISPKIQKRRRRQKPRPPSDNFDLSGDAGDISDVSDDNQSWEDAKITERSMYNCQGTLSSPTPSAFLSTESSLVASSSYLSPVSMPDQRHSSMAITEDSFAKDKRLLAIRKTMDLSEISPISSVFHEASSPRLSFTKPHRSDSGNCIVRTIGIPELLDETRFSPTNAELGTNFQTPRTDDAGFGYCTRVPLSLLESFVIIDDLNIFRQDSFDQTSGDDSDIKDLDMIDFAPDGECQGDDCSTQTNSGTQKGTRDKNLLRYLLQNRIYRVDSTQGLTSLDSKNIIKMLNSSVWSSDDKRRWYSALLTRPNLPVLSSIDSSSSSSSSSSSFSSPSSLSRNRHLWSQRYSLRNRRRRSKLLQATHLNRTAHDTSLPQLYRDNNQFRNDMSSSTTTSATKDFTNDMAISDTNTGNSSSAGGILPLHNSHQPQTTLQDQYLEEEEEIKENTLELRQVLEALGISLFCVVLTLGFKTLFYVLDPLGDDTS